MQPYWPAWTLVLAIALVAVTILFITREVRRYRLVLQEAELVDSSTQQHNHQELTSSADHFPLPYRPERVTAIKRPRRSNRMKIYLVTIADQKAIISIDAAIDNDEQLYIGDLTSSGPIAVIEEYVNVDSP